jgi:Lon protease-like protein
MVQIDALPDGRYAVVAVGTRRIRVLAWLPDDPYPLADVEDWPDDDADADGLPARVEVIHDKLGAVLDLAVRAGDLRDVPDLQVSDDPLLASYHLAGLAPIGPADRFRLLSARSPAERLDLLAEVLDDVEAMLRFRLA